MIVAKTCGSYGPPSIQELVRRLLLRVAWSSLYQRSMYASTLSRAHVTQLITITVKSKMLPFTTSADAGYMSTFRLKATDDTDRAAKSKDVEVVQDKTPRCL